MGICFCLYSHISQISYNGYILVLFFNTFPLPPSLNLHLRCTQLVNHTPQAMAHHQRPLSMASILFYIHLFLPLSPISTPSIFPSPTDTHSGIFKVCSFYPYVIHLLGCMCIQIDKVKNIYEELKCCFMIVFKFLHKWYRVVNLMQSYFFTQHHVFEIIP